VTDDKPAEEAVEDVPRGSALARFFLVPLLVVITAVGIFFAFSLLTFEKRSPADYLQEVRGGSANRRWQAAFELSRSIGAVPAGPERDRLAAEALRVFQGLTGKRPEDVAVRRYLVLVLGKLGDLSAGPALLEAVKDPDPETRLYAVWALGALRDARALDAVVEASLSEDAGMRKMAAYVLGQLGDKRAVGRLQVLAEDRSSDVRWNAAIALAELGDRSGLPVLRTMIDRESLARQATLSADQAETALVSALKALELLKDTESLPAIERLAREDPNLRVRAAAQRAADATRGKASSVLERPARDLVG
jgi:HEAT repeat protein